MTLDDLEKRLRETPVTEPNPAWREQILTNCASPTPLFWTKAVALTAAVCMSSLSLHLLLNTNSAEQVPRQATMTESSSPHSILPRSRERLQTEDSFWDSILLKEADELPTPDTPMEDVAAALIQYQEVLDRFTVQIRQPNLSLPDPLPIARFRQTSEALMYHRALMRFESGDSHGAVEACLAPFPLIQLLGKRSDPEAAITHVGLIGISIFAIGKARGFATDDGQLRILQEALLDLRPLDSIVQVFERWLTSKAGIDLPEHAALYYRALIDAWDTDANGLKLEETPSGFDRNQEPVNEHATRYINVLHDTADVEYRTRHVAIALMLERHRRAYGEIPDSLEDLIPEFTAFVPNSPWTGQPYDYEKISADNARMSSPDPFDDQPNEMLLRALDRE